MNKTIEHKLVEARLPRLYDSQSMAILNSLKDIAEEVGVSVDDVETVFRYMVEAGDLKYDNNYKIYFMNPDWEGLK